MFGTEIGEADTTAKIVPEYRNANEEGWAMAVCGVTRFTLDDIYPVNNIK